MQKITITKRKKHKKKNILNKQTKTKTPPEKCKTEGLIRVKANLIVISFYFVVFTAPL